MYVAV
jgi:vacuolar protein sorting-associated protein 13A/C